MARNRILRLSILIVVPLFPISHSAAQPLNQPEPREIRSEWGVWSGFSFHTLSLGGLSSSDIQGRKLLLAGVRYSRLLTRRENLSISYTLDMIPVAVAFQSQTQAAGASEYSRENVYGFGASPVGFKFDFLPNHSVQPFFGLTGGFLYFQKPVPNPIGTRWNFTATGGGGLQVPIGEHRAVTIGYMFHHLSNGKQQKENPSLNTNMIFLGFSFVR